MPTQSWIPPFLAFWSMAFCLVAGWAIQGYVTSRRERKAQEPLPPVLPAWLFDHSDATSDGVTYCPQCCAGALNGWHVEPRGHPMFCSEHHDSILARAIAARLEEAKR